MLCFSDVQIAAFHDEVIVRLSVLRKTILNPELYVFVRELCVR